MHPLVVLLIVGSPDAKRDIETAYAKMAAAAHVRDASAAGKFLDEEFITQVQGRWLSRAQFERFERESFKRLKSVEASPQVKTITMQGGKAIVRCTESLSATLPGAKGSSHRLQIVEDREDVWIQRKGKWRLKMSQTLSEKATLDKKNVPNPGFG